MVRPCGRTIRHFTPMFCPQIAHFFASASLVRRGVSVQSSGMATTNAKGTTMEPKAGDTVLVAVGTTMVLEEGGEYTRTVMDAECADSPLVVDYVGGCHSTMNGGGRDYLLHCPFSGVKVRIRSTFQTPATRIFQAA